MSSWRQAHSGWVVIIIMKNYAAKQHADTPPFKNCKQSNMVIAGRQIVVRKSGNSQFGAIDG